MSVDDMRQATGSSATPSGRRMGASVQGPRNDLLLSPGWSAGPPHGTALETESSGSAARSEPRVPSTTTIDMMKVDTYEAVVEQTRWLANIVQDESRRLRGQIDDMHRAVLQCVHMSATTGASGHRRSQRAASSPTFGRRGGAAQPVSTPILKEFAGACAAVAGAWPLPPHPPQPPPLLPKAKGSPRDRGSSSKPVEREGAAESSQASRPPRMSGSLSDGASSLSIDEVQPAVTLQKSGASSSHAASRKLRRKQFRPTSRSDLERTSMDSRPESLPAERSRRNSAAQASSNISTLRDLDTLLTDQLFERLGLLAETRGTTDSSTVPDRASERALSGSSSSTAAAQLGRVKSIFRNRPVPHSDDGFGSDAGITAVVCGKATGHGGFSISPRVTQNSNVAEDGPIATSSFDSGAKSPKSDRAAPLTLRWPRHPAEVPGASAESDLFSGRDSCSDGEDESGCGDGDFSDIGDLYGMGNGGIELAMEAQESRRAEVGEILAKSPTRLLSTSPSLMDALRMQRERLLVDSHGRSAAQRAPCRMQGACTDATEEDLRRTFPSWMLSVWGVTPFAKRFVCWVYAQTVLVAMAALPVVLSFMDEDPTTPSSRYFQMAVGCLACGAFLGMALLRRRKIHDLLGPCEQPIGLYVASFGFQRSWTVVSTRRLIIVMGLWMWSTLSHTLMNLYFGCPQSGEASHFACLVNFISVGGLCSVFFSELHVCSAMDLAIDHFCLRLFESQDAAVGTLQWNVLQAMLRRAAHILEGGFLAASTGVLGAVVLTSMEIIRRFGASDSSSLRLGWHNESVCMSLWAGWLGPPVLLVFFVVFRAAAVTEQCCRVPSLVNSWMFPERFMDREKRCIVDYIARSAAGFYVRGVRLTGTSALKLAYLFGVLMFSLLTQSVLKEN
mmetsp:Transcript_9358/g.26952  ORF Transcript_9358/g.26952 Transcript_9358/m.26952 type:complete len:900 (+) Transcript_9358:67-2766(+)